MERAANWACPLALLCLQASPGYVPRDLLGLGDALAPLDEKLSAGGDLRLLFKYMGYMFLAVWGLVPVLRMRRK